MRFKRVYIEISNICNLNCNFCSPLKREKQSMTVLQFTEIVKQIKPYTDFIYFHVKGEPLMHPLLEEFLNIAYEHKLRVNLTTNGTLLTEREELLLSHPAVRQVNISIHAFSALEYNIIDNDTYIKTAVQFAKKANKKGIYVVLRLWNLDNDNNIDSGSLAVMNYIEKEFVNDTDYPFQTPIALKMGGRKSIKIARHSFVGWEQEFTWPTLENQFVSDSGYCYGMRHQIAILVDGTVVPCCLDANGEAELGNIFSSSFSDIIESKRAKAIRHGFENQLAVDELCKRCSFRTKFDEFNN